MYSYAIEWNAIKRCILNHLYCSENGNLQLSHSPLTIYQTSQHTSASVREQNIVIVKSITLELTNDDNNNYDDLYKRLLFLHKFSIQLSVFDRLIFDAMRKTIVPFGISKVRIKNKSICIISLEFSK